MYFNVEHFIDQIFNNKYISFSRNITSLTSKYILVFRYLQFMEIMQKYAKFSNYMYYTIFSVY